MSRNIVYISLKSHYTTGGPEVTGSVWIPEDERWNLHEDGIIHEIFVHDRERPVGAPQLPDCGSVSSNNRIKNSYEKFVEPFTREVSSLE